MIHLISAKKARGILRRYADWIETLSKRYRVPSAAIKAILYQEMIQIDLLDPLVDLVVLTGLFPKKDSSTGFAQIFGYVGLNAVNFAVDHGLATYESLGFSVGHRLDSTNSRDARMVWLRLRRNTHANIEIATLNILAAADEMTGRIDFSTFSEEELQLVFTRYNANVHYVTAYGRQAYRNYLEFKDEEEAERRIDPRQARARSSKTRATRQALR